MAQEPNQRSPRFREHQPEQSLFRFKGGLREGTVFFLVLPLRFWSQKRILIGLAFAVKACQLNVTTEVASVAQLVRAVDS
jgi:hypothetical protein